MTEIQSKGGKLSIFMTQKNLRWLLRFKKELKTNCMGLNEIQMTITFLLTLERKWAFAYHILKGDHWFVFTIKCACIDCILLWLIINTYISSWKSSWAMIGLYNPETKIRWKQLKVSFSVLLTAFLDQPVAVIEGNNLITKEVICVLILSQAIHRVIELDVFELIS